MKCDAIVNAAKMSLLGGGALDGKFHRRAGIGLSLKCKAIPVKGTYSDGNDIRCHIGKCEVTDTVKTNLENRVRYVFHAVGPDCRVEPDMILNAMKLRSCYESILQKVIEYNVDTIKSTQ